MFPIPIDVGLEIICHYPLNKFSSKSSQWFIVGFVLEQSQATIYHNNLTVGFWHLNASTPWTAQSGAISDMLLTIHIDPGYTEGLSLLKDFMENKLVFHLDVAVAGSIQWGSWQLYRLKTQVKNIEFLVGEELDRSICKCKDYYD